MALESMDVAEEKREQLKHLLNKTFPEVFNENKVDFEQLQRVLGETIDTGKERYGLTWPGKADCMKVIQEPSRATLKPCREESVNFDNTENLFIEGDNLEVLKLLQKSYFGKVKMIYIDPPYNTGKEFIYPDNYQETIETYMAYAGLVNGEGKKFSTNSTTEGRFHSKWLNMMYPRLYLAKNLLREDGVIFISIDDNEVENLRRLCNEIIGEENFVCSISWFKKVSPSNDAKWFSNDHEYVLVYAKNKEQWRPNKLPLNERQQGYYSNPDNDERGSWNSVTYTCNKTSQERPNLYFPITNPNTGNEIWPKKSAVWKYSRDVVTKHISEGLLYWGKDGNASTPRYKKFLKDSNGAVPRSVWRYEDVGHTQMATVVFQGLISEVKFDTPKPPKLIKQMMRLALSNSENNIVLDFFSGSGTIGQAAMELKIEQKINASFLAVQLPEKIENDTFYSVADITKERLRRVIQQISSEQEIEKHSLGFRVLKLDKSHFGQWQSEVEPGNIEQLQANLELHSNHIDENVEQEALLYELLLKAGFELTESIEQQTFGNQSVFSIAEGALLICLEDRIEPETVEAMVKAEPAEIIIKDSAFAGNDQLKVNAVQTVKAYNQNSETDIVFKVV